MPNLQLGNKQNRQRSWRIFFLFSYRRSYHPRRMMTKDRGRNFNDTPPPVSVSVSNKTRRRGRKNRNLKSVWWHRERICCGVSHLFLFAILILSAAAGLKENSDDEIGRDNFPKSFVFGAGASAYQVINGSFQFSIFNFLWTYMHVWFGSFPASERLILGFYLGEFFVGWRSRLWRRKSS